MVSIFYSHLKDMSSHFNIEINSPQDSASESKVLTREDQKSSNSWAVAVATGALSYALRSYSDDLVMLLKAENVKHKLKFQPGSLDAITLENRLRFDEVNDAAIKTLETKCTRSKNILLIARNILIITGLTLAAGIAAVAGGMLTVQWLVTASIIGGVALAAIGLFMITRECKSNTDLPSDFASKMDHLLSCYETGESKSRSVSEPRQVSVSKEKVVTTNPSAAAAPNSSAVPNLSAAAAPKSSAASNPSVVPNSGAEPNLSAAAAPNSSAAPKLGVTPKSQVVPLELYVVERDRKLDIDLLAPYIFNG